MKLFIFKTHRAAIATNPVSRLYSFGGKRKMVDLNQKALQPYRLQSF